ncbi:DUF4365 domain-containing protein [Microcoleus sp.]|uniref:DUF4365 domain-containing protein n=1 Tax=Microcoleus sp. TaxID=44472 RepID=UPI003526713C
MDKPRYDPIQDEGVSTIGRIFNKELKWIFREQQKADMGIDAHVEVCDNGQPSGRLIALQIKSGESWFKEKIDEGIVFRGSLEHLKYWSEHSLPVIITLYNPSSEKVFWQAVLPKYITRTPKAWKIVVPHSKKLDKQAELELRSYSKDSPVIEGLKKLRFTAYGNYLEQDFYKKLKKIASTLEPKSSSVEAEPIKLTAYQVIALEALKRLLELGVSMDFSREVYSWLMKKDVMSHAIRLVELGYQTFLIIGSDGKPAIWNDADLADYLFLGSENRKIADAIICLNDIINSLFETLGYDKQPIKHELFYTYRENIKEIKFIWEEELAKIESGESKPIKGKAEIPAK